MKNLYFLFCALLCAFYLFLNVRKVALRGKTMFVPSTFFAVGWLLSSLGIFFYSNGIADDGNSNGYYESATHLEEIGEYQFIILLVIFTAFLLARKKSASLQFEIPELFIDYTLPKVSDKLKIFLYAYFFFGIIRLYMVVSVTGLDYNAMRSYYIATSSSFDWLDLNLIRLASYLAPIVTLYICLFGIENAIHGLNLKKVFISFLLFAPFRMSFGGRLFILSYFLPFFFAYFFVHSIWVKDKQFLKTEKKKIILLLSVPIFLVVFFQIIKMGESVSLDGICSFSTEIFYPAAAYRYMNELWEALPSDFKYGMGRNTLGLGHDIHLNIRQSWTDVYNTAIVCVPSMIPDIYLDFGKIGSLFVFFVLFYNLERKAFVLASRFSLRNFLLFIVLCTTAFSSNTSSASLMIKSLLISFLSVIAVCRLVVKKLE